jgi:hypothetical protein
MTTEERLDWLEEQLHYLKSDFMALKKQLKEHQEDSFTAHKL